MADIIIKENEPLHRVMDIVKETNASVTEALTRFDKVDARLTAAEEADKESLGEQQERWAAMDKHLTELDAKLERGKKLYGSPNGDDIHTERREEVGKFMADIFLGKRGSKTQFGYWERAQSVGTAADGGYPVPVELVPEVSRIVETYGLAFSLCRVMPMKRLTMQIPRSLAGPTITIPGENPSNSVGLTTLASTSATLDQPSMTAKQFLAWDAFSLELDEDADPFLMQFLVDIFGQVLAKGIDTAAFNTSSGVFMAPLYADNVGEVTLGTGSTSFHQLNTRAIIDTFDAASEFCQDRGSWLSSAYVRNQIRAMANAQNDLLWGPLAGTAPNTLLGQPYHVSAVMPKKAQSTTAKAFLLYGDFKQGMLLGDRKQPTIDFDNSVGFTSGSIVMRIRSRLDIKVIQPTALARLKTA